jgi:formate C-acetyltransferase
VAVAAQTGSSVGTLSAVRHTERVDRLYALLRDRMTRPQKTWGRHLTVLDDPAVAAAPIVVRHARALEKLLREIPVVIEADDLVVGNVLRDGVVLRTGLPRFATAEEQAEARSLGAPITDHLSHKTPYYYDLMAKGLGGIIAEVEQKIAEVGGRASEPERGEKLAFLEACRIECRAVIAFAHRYAELAERLAAGAGEPRRSELRRIVEVCRRVPENPPRSFAEAVQSFWFLNHAFHVSGTKISCGRLDQYLYPSLRRDLESGGTSLEAAQELVDCLWLRFNDRSQIVRENFYTRAGSGDLPESLRDAVVVVERSPRTADAGHRSRPGTAADAADAINHFGQNILLSGLRPDGADGTNELTYLCLNAMEKLAVTQPVVTLRLHKASPPELVERAAQVLKSGGGMPYINNDDVLVRAYAALGVPVEDARDYANSNCWETMIEGRSDQELIRGENFLLFLELALNRGRSRVHGLIGPDTGDPLAWRGIDDLMEAWKLQADTHIARGIDHIGSGIANGTLEHSSHGRFRYNPLLSALTLDCLERERDIIRGGARYRIWHVMAEAVANAVDAVSAIHKLVFEERAVGMDELLRALEADWDGFENLRRRFASRAPRFANDSDYADDAGRQMMRWYIERTRAHALRYPGVIFPCSVGTFSWYAMIGKELGASPDGRRAYEAIAANFSPAAGADMSGPTAAVNSYLKMSVDELAGGAPIDLRFSSSGLRGEQGTRRLAGLIRAFVELGGNMLTATVTDVEELRRAMQEPEKYRHLRVRMGGWSAYFVMLGEEQQRIHISRVEHGLA